MEFLRHPLSRTRGPARQQGVSLLFALLALVAMSLASVALVQSIGTGASVIGNIGLKQDATAASDQAVRQAITAIYTKLNAFSNNLDNDVTSIGYYATSNDNIDVTGSQLTGASNRQMVKWLTRCDTSNGGTCPFIPVTLSTPINGNTAQYVIFRLCNTVGDPIVDTTIQCAVPVPTTSKGDSNRNSLSYKDPRISASTATPYYRIVVRVGGSRNTVTYTETILHF